VGELHVSTAKTNGNIFKQDNVPPKTDNINHAAFDVQYPDHRIGR
jgi:hypothetical protein